jgi:beta-galactosidase/beta-glucuronidase
MNRHISIIFAALLLAPLATLHADDLEGNFLNKRVAYDDAGEPTQQPHLLEGENWTFANPGAATPAARSVVFGQTVKFGYANLNPQANYQAKITFFADEDRSMLVKADRLQIGKASAHKGKTETVTLDIPVEAITDGKFILAIEKITGPNAVVSEIEILSYDARQLIPMANAKEEILRVDLPDFEKLTPILSPQPTAVAKCANPVLDLGGVWKFIEAVTPGFEKTAPQNWKDIRVPGEWSMQGFKVKHVRDGELFVSGDTAGYFRTFTVPADWKGKAIKLRCDAVYSDATVFVNGKEAGKHQGGFTPFELDVTGLVTIGAENSIALSICSESTADSLASASKYACHQLGGISRGIKLFALPKTHLSSLFVVTKFDAKFKDATLELETAVEGGDAELLLSLARITSDKSDKSDKSDLSDIRIKPGHSSIPVATPAKWDNEHPNLYLLTVKVEVGGNVVETVTQKIGFRQIEICGNETFVNGKPVKLRGSNRHEVYPSTGRSLPAGIHRYDIELFREGNVNLIRTCHYPPDEALLDSADELGMFIECEAPFCWSPGDGHVELVCRQTAEMVVAYRNHPSVILWSVANESGWGPNFIASSKLIHHLDPTRPRIFNTWYREVQLYEEGFIEVANLHYPGRRGPEIAKKYTKRPIYLGEETHLNAYNRLELATDPALRDLWGRTIRELWDLEYSTTGVLGQSIWSGIDDTFYMYENDTVGFGAWGPIDGWRRPKPEYWGMKKAYSPVRLGKPELTDGSVTIAVENRNHFSNLNEMRITWKLGTESGTVTADIAPGTKGSLTIRPNSILRADAKLELTFTDPRGFVADQFSLALSPPIGLAPVEGTINQGDTALHPTSNLRSTGTSPVAAATEWTLDEKTGLITAINGQPVNGPHLMLLPMNKTGETQMHGKTKVWTPFTAPCTGWVCEKVEKTAAGATVTGHYDNANGSYTYTSKSGGVVEVTYDFTVTKPVSPRQTGLVFTLPHACETLAWEREGYWDVYPEDHIARLKGTVKASEGFEATSVGPRTKPSHPWRLDNLPYGNNDFCSTKHNIFTASLADAAGKGISVNSQGKQHFRAWRTADAVSFLVADYSNGGSEGFLRGLCGKDDRPLKVGDKITGKVQLEQKVN